MKPPATHHTNYPHPSALHPRHSLTVSRSLPYPLSPRRSLAFLNRCSGIHFLPLRSRRNLKDAEAVRFDGPVLDVKEIQGEECELVVETCVTRTLPPVVTMEAGLQSIKDAVEELKLNPPSSSSGVLRFQVALPPSPKALNWFCAHPPLSGVFPRFFLSKETGDPSCKTLHLNRTHGVLGIGAAIYFTHSSCSSPGDRKSLIRRYISSDTVGMTAYGFEDVNFQSSFKLETGSVYFCIPEIELDELVDTSILSATLAWNDSTSNIIRQAIQSLELSLHEANYHFWTATERSDYQSIASALGKANLLENGTFKMFSAQVELLEGNNYPKYSSELKGTTYSSQFCFRLSPTIGISYNMLDLAGGTNYHLQHHPNINAVWAALIVEECTRLGLTFFCIAPGSRSSPLAIAASSHHKTTCIACFDERALAFHAVGYSKASQKPAVIITSSGTAVSNLLPAVVEASQEFVPLLLLTADRPPELQDTGANQTINQVNHFGSFVRFFFNLPVPSDDIPARMVLTTLDSAVNWATSPPYGPVHINCPFREPLDDSPKKWVSSCLTGLDSWMCKSDPFTKYIKFQHSRLSNIPMLTEVIEIIQGANRGLLLICALDDEDEIWAALILAKHLHWPVVADILSGLRLRKVLATCPGIQENIVFLDHLDHILLSKSVKRWIQFDVILQIGTRITSKRISQMLEECNPFAYIIVDNHPCRHDPSHVVSHRIQSSIVQFVDSLMKVQLPHATRNFSSHLQALNEMVAWDISFQIAAERSLTEPHVAQVISELLDEEFALFVGNSMPIRDSDMYGRSWKHQTCTAADILSCSELPCLGIRVSGNRGASGIDGLLSTATGFATGGNRRVLCLIGDVSFLHDTNGLSLLNCRTLRKPVTVLVINNHGGAIFGLLPIADRTSPTVLSQYFYTTHNISIQKLCLAHSVRHILVKTKTELQDALVSSRDDASDCVIEVESGIDSNTTFHSSLRQSACQAADNALSSLSRLSVPSSDGFLFCKMEYSLYRIQLCAPTTASSLSDGSEFHKEGYVLSLFLEDGTVGYGEVAPLEIHKESLADAEEQLRFLCHVIEGAKISCTLPLLQGTFTSWLWNNLGIPECSIFPSVRCGLEMAILNAMAARTGSSLLDILLPQKATEEMHGTSGYVKLCALLDSNGTPHEVAYIAASLVAEGFTAIKLKVARRENPIEDAAVLQEVRNAVGQEIQLRVDANRKWTFEEAILFGSLVKDSGLQYIEEPVQNEEEIVKYCNESGLPVALDETIDNIAGNPLDILAKYAHPNIVAVVIKPGVVGGFEKAALIARWAQKEGKMAVVSAAFESGLALSTYALFSRYLEMHHGSLSIAHGLGTYRWLTQDTTTCQLRVSPDPCSGSMGVSTADAIRHLQQFQLDDNIMLRAFSGEEVRAYTLDVKTNELSCSVRIREVGQMNRRHDGDVVVFLHGLLGTGEDWIPIMKAASGSARCISVDLPGHGETKTQDQSWSVERVSELLNKLIEDLTPGSVTLVGYSMGARIALHMALRHRDKINGAVIISGSPGLKEGLVRKIRRAKDDSRARNLITYGLHIFLSSWYAGKLWKSLRCHPHYKEVVASRSRFGDARSLAKALIDLSIGRQEPLWDELKRCKLPLMIVVGAHDDKFKGIARQMLEEIETDSVSEIVEVPASGHAVHLENPLHLIHALSQFVTRIRNDSGPPTRSVLSANVDDLE